MTAHRFPNAAVASPHYLASSAGLAVLTSGGNAIDAAIAMNLVLSVAYPHMCGLGGDLLAMVWNEGDLSGLYSSGRLPMNAAPVETVPRTGIGSAIVPGAVAGWKVLRERFGTRDLDDLAKPAIGYARCGVARAPGLARITGLMRPLLEQDPEAARIFLADDLRQPELAETLERLDDFNAHVGGKAPPPFTQSDFEAHEPEWVEPERLEWQGLEVCEMPAPSRGPYVLRALKRLESLDGLTPADAEWHQRLMRAHGPPGVHGDTIYLCARDSNGMSVSLSQSLKDAFGSGVMIHGTGVMLHNRGADHTPDTYRPGARLPVHTLAPAMVLRDGEPLLIFGSMGGPSQTQIHLQLLSRIFVAGEDIGDAIAAPRWRVMPRGTVAEAGLPDLGATPGPMPDVFGHAHAIRVETDGSLAAAFDPRSDGAALGY